MNALIEAILNDTPRHQSIFELSELWEYADLGGEKRRGLANASPLGSIPAHAGLHNPGSVTVLSQPSSAL